MKDCYMKKNTTKIGIILTKLGGLDIRALKYLVLFQNTLQESFEFEFLPTPEKNDFLEKLDSSEPLDRKSVEQNASKFFAQYDKESKEEAEDFELSYEPPDCFVILSTAKFADEYYVTGEDNWLIIALGHWQRSMAPPSIVEFFLALLVGTAIDTSCGENFPDRHHATKGCIFDFTADLDDARLGVLTGFLCESCCDTIKQSQSQKLIEDAKLLLRKEWLGDSSKPANVANTVKKLGYDLFHTKGVKQTPWERLSLTIQEEAIKSLLKIIGGIILAGLLIWLGLKST
jgi:hypothetical protein